MYDGFIPSDKPEGEEYENTGYNGENGGNGESRIFRPVKELIGDPALVPQQDKHIIDAYAHLEHSVFVDEKGKKAERERYDRKDQERGILRISDG